jgi:hypothetical protein
MSIKKSDSPAKLSARRLTSILGVAVAYIAVLAMFGVLAVGIATAFGALGF